MAGPTRLTESARSAKIATSADDFDSDVARMGIASRDHTRELMPMSARDVKVLERITTALSDAGKTQTELAHETGLEKTALSKALAGKRRLNLFETAAIADVLGLTLDELVADDQPVFAMRATGIEEGVLNEAQSECARIVEDFLTLRALVGEQR